MPQILRRIMCGIALLAATGVNALAGQPYNAKAFDDARAAGKPVLINVTASWCPTCRQQKPIIGAIETERPELTVFDVDFDAEKDALKRFRVRSQSTLIVFKGDKEIDRSTGETDPKRLQALVAKAF